MKIGKKKFSADETATFCSQTAMLLNGGITLYEGMDYFYQDMRDSATRDVLKTVDDKLTEGSSLSEALKATEAFPEYMVQMTEVGERTGKLEEVMNGLAAYYERESAVSAGIKNVITYPIMLFAMMAVILAALVFKILPMFEAVFEELDNRTAGTEVMMSTGLTTARIAAVVVFVILLLLLGTLSAYRIKNGSNTLGRFINTFPFLAGIADRMGVGRFLAAMSLMVGSGMEMGEAVEKAAVLPEDSGSLEKTKKACELVSTGEALDTVMNQSGILSGIESRMLSVGLRSGAADQVLEKLSERHDDELSERMSTLSTKIEVALVILLSVMVGIILLTVMMPLISVIASI